MSPWNDAAPIYRQLADRLTDRLLAGELPDGAAMPSVRVLASQYLLNPLTVGRAMQLMVDEQLLESRRGLGMFVRPGASARLRESARSRFLAHEWPAIVARARQLGISPRELEWDLQPRDL